MVKSELTLRHQHRSPRNSQDPISTTPRCRIIIMSLRPIEKNLNLKKYQYDQDERKRDHFSPFFYFNLTRQKRTEDGFVITNSKSSRGRHRRFCFSGVLGGKGIELVKLLRSRVRLKHRKLSGEFQRTEGKQDPVCTEKTPSGLFYASLCFDRYNNVSKEIYVKRRSSYIGKKYNSLTFKTLGVESIRVNTKTQRLENQDEEKRDLNDLKKEVSGPI